MSKTGPGRRKHSARVEQNRERVRREILQAAKDILGTEGKEAVTLASVAGRLSMTKQALYHYFPSKEALSRNLVSALLHDEVEALLAVVTTSGPDRHTLGILIRAFYDHYIRRLDVFRLVYCQTQLYAEAGSAIDESTLREEIHPHTRLLFDRLEEHLADTSASSAERREARQRAFTAWTSALGLLTMLSIADANQDPLLHSDRELLETLANVFESPRA